MPASASSTSSAPPVQFAESAALNTGHTCPFGRTPQIMSTTQPRKCPGIEQPVGQVAQRATEYQPERHRPTRECSRWDTRAMATTTTTAIRVSSQVMPVTMPKAAPGLRTTCR